MNFSFAALELRILIIAVMASLMIGGIWHGLIFRPETTKKVRRTSHLMIFFLTDLITAVMLSWLILRLDLQGPSAGALLGFVTWIGWTAPSGLAHHVTHHRSTVDWTGDGGRQLFSLLAMGAILGAWS